MLRYVGRYRLLSRFRRHVACLPFPRRRVAGIADPAPLAPPAGISGHRWRELGERVSAGGYAAVMEGVERVWHRRLRWRLRGAWQWPAFMALTLVDAVLLVLLPPYDGAPEHLFPGVLLAGSVNLRRARPARAAAGTGAAPPPPATCRASWRPTTPAPRSSGDHRAAGRPAGLAHRSAAQAEEGRAQAVAAAMHAYVVEQAPEHRDSARRRRHHPHRPRLLPRVHPGRRRAPLALPVRDHRPAPAGRHARHRGGLQQRYAVRRS